MKHIATHFFRFATLGALAAALAACAGSSNKRPQSELAALRAQAAPEPQSLLNPIQGKRFADNWGVPRSGGRKHQGVDIFAPKGTPIRSTSDGIVVKKGNGGLGGKTVTVQGAGAQHYYAHLSRFAGKKPYQRVRAGEIIGYVGQTGNAKNTPPHLHYGVYPTRGGAVNPYPLINQNR
ncbi:MAG: M23 family metallopeptidase [Neisseria sp.]|nr:M23 family metallopeptidase [Neisseria sp.]